MLNTHALVLNRSFHPVHVTSVRRAFSLLYQGVAKALDDEYRLYDFGDWAALSAAGHDSVSTVQSTLRVPRVVVLSAYDHLPKGRVRFSRVNIYARDRDTCQYCGRTLSRSELNLDHVVPRAQGGRTTWENVVCSCVPCNLRKGGRTPEQAGMSLLVRPARPRWTPLFRGPVRRVTYREWLPFLSLADASYWNVELRDG
ncbi:MAG TPA: HNH endonuclease [Myxococcaceae bacterium]|jgi:5-methylcytosine-specific restriction endonuclease McrA|nr:HNH endonuclease [Myxococcaceae bacterium]